MSASRKGSHGPDEPDFCRVAHWPDKGLWCVVNNTDRAQSTTVTFGDGSTRSIDLEPSGIVWGEA